MQWGKFFIIELALFNSLTHACAVKDLQPDSSGFPPQAVDSHAIHRVVAFKQKTKGRFNVLLPVA
ncbi:MAG: hypothetical protein MSG64_01170 [Pyrinomonadaceae bacterium MAG19_C2-C3]|nr:hypothetical protein [Pyrinomonadaceae bacterium MAG19_C2-C3]